MAVINKFISALNIRACMTSMSFTTDPIYRPSAASENAMRIIEEAEYGGGDVFDCIRTMQKIRPGNMEDWISEWTKIAKISKEKGDEAMKKGHLLTARKSYLNAYNYYRHGSFFILMMDPRKAEYYKLSDECFRKAAALFDPPFEYLSVDYEGKTLDAILYHTKKPGKNPLVIYVLGLDAQKEEYYFLGIEEALGRGLNVLVIDGPGQASSLFMKGIRGTPHYEKPVGAFLDALSKREDLDMNRVAIVGRSFAGYHAPRAAAFEPRIKALVVWGAFYSLHGNLSRRKEAMARFKEVLGVDDEAAFMEKAKEYSLEGVASKITCPMLVLHGEADPQVDVNDARRLYQEASSKDKELVIFKLGEPGSGHCAHDAPSIAFPMVFDWVMDKMASL